jgi:hypothetical protein
MNPIKQLEAVLCDQDGKCCINGSDADRAIVDAALAELKLLHGLLDQPEGEPVGIVVYKPKMLRVGALNTAGMALPDGTRLYSRPAPFVPISADMVTDEMLEAFHKNAKVFLNPEAFAAAVNAYMGAKK